jgi:HAD superfamily hydrolase (TIGR01549 family)
MTDAQVNFIHMHTADESIRHIFSGTPFLDKAQAFRIQMKYAPFIKDMIMEAGLKELLMALKADYGLAVATNRSDTIGDVLESNGLTEFFDIVVSSLDVEKPKPDPEPIYRILDFFKILPDQCLYVGDSLVDWQTAGAAGVHFAAYGNDDLETPWKVKNLIGIKDVLGELEKG